MQGTIEWSCDKCGVSGTIEYETPNPYKVGYQAYEAHEKASPHYGVKLCSLKFKP